MSSTRILVTGLAVLLLSALPLFAAIPASERSALVALYQSADGDGWIDRSGWLDSPGTECGWYGVSCDETESTVIDLSLWSNNLVGTIPDSINALPNLQGLSLAGNVLTGPLPSTIGQLIHLRWINLQENGLTGGIPTSMWNLADLEELWLFNNQLSGPISIRIGHLDSAKVIDITNNDLTGDLPEEVGDLSNLESLSLAGNQLSGEIPARFGDLKKLQHLNLEENQLTGAIPAALGDAFELRTLRLQGNQLSGSIPPELGRLRNLEILDLSLNQLTGAIPSGVVSISNLVSLYIASNSLTGPIPSSIGNLAKAESFDLSYNQLSGSIPSQISQMARVQYLALGGNQLTGPIPAGITSLGSLIYVDFSGNQLDGAIPPNLESLVNLETLALGHNQLTGPIPSSLGSLPNLKYIDLAENRLSGPIPDSLANLSRLEWLSLFSNQLTGTIPTWLGTLDQLTGFLLGGNVIGGTIPSNLTNLENLATLDLCGNFVSGPIPSDIGRLSKLQYLSLCENDLSGPVPAQLWSLTEMIDLRLESNQLTGSLPPEIGDMDEAEVILLSGNQIEGEIPPEISGLEAVQVLSLGGNRLEGVIPPEIGDLTRLVFLDLDQNALRGEVPSSLANLSSLEVEGLRLGFNALYTNSQALRAFINQRHDGGPFEATQTLAPTGLRVSEVSDRSATVSWNAIPYVYDEGGYEIVVTPVGGGTPIVATTPSKELTSWAVHGMAPSTSYSVVVRSTTHPHGYQQNFIRSDASSSVSFTTGARVESPALVDVVSQPGGLIQIGGVPTSSTSYTLANFGDVPTDITLEQTESFFTQSPLSFTLAPGASQIVTVSSVPDQAPGSYWGAAFPVGDGVPEDLYVTIQLLSVASPGGRAVAEAETSRIELAGEVGVDAIGTAIFRNVGTANLAGILVSDVDWIETRPELIEIPVNEIRSINFDVRRSKRPDAASGGAGTLFGTLRLVYLDATGLSSSAGPSPSDGTGVSETLVTIVDTTRPRVEELSIPPLGAGDVYRLIPGVIDDEEIVTDFFITNSFGSRPLRNAEVYFQPEGGASASVATLEEIAPSQSLALASVVDSVFASEGVRGTLVVRTPNAEERSSLVSARYIHAGNLLDEVPVFRSDRGLSAGGELYLSGVENDADDLTTLYVQEVSGGTASVLVDAYDVAGRLVQSGLTLGPIEPFGTARTTILPKGATVMVVRNSAQSTGSIAAWAHVANRTTGSGPAIVDWSIHRGFEWSDETRVPVVIRDGDAPARRRPVRRASSGKAAFPAAGDSAGGTTATAVTLFNPDDSPAAVRLTLEEAGGDRETSLTLAAKETRLIDDVAVFLKGSATRTNGSLTVIPLIGRVVVSARLVDLDDHDLIAPVPVVASGSGLRLGQSRLFAGLEDSRQTTIDEGIGGTARTSFGIAEIAGSSVTVRATLFVFDGGSIAGALVSRDFRVGPHQLLVVDDMARSIIGPQRETLFGDMRNLQLELRVVEGDGAANVFVLSRDNGSHDPLLLIE